MRHIPPVNSEYFRTGDDLWWLHGLFSLLVVVALVVGAVVIVRMLARRPPGWTAHLSPRNPAIDELDLRYARGEVDRADYLQRRSDLTERHGLRTSSPDQPKAGPGPGTGG